MAGEIRIGLRDRAFGNVRAGVLDSRFTIECREVGAADRSVLVQQQSRAKGGAVIVQFRGMFQVANCFVQPIFLPEMERRIQPGGGIVRIQILRKLEFLFRRFGLGKFAGGLRQIIAKQSALWLQRSRRLEGSARFGEFAIAH